MKETHNRRFLKKAVYLSIIAILLFSTVAVMANTMKDQTSIMFKELDDNYIQSEQLNTEENEPEKLGRDILFEDGFESYNDFVLNFPPWTQYDGDGGQTYGIQDVTFPNQGYVGSYSIFVPSQTTPPISGAWDPHSGLKYAACFASVPGFQPNDDWMFTPQLIADSYDELSFWAKSVTAQYGLERMRVGVSTTDINPSSFEILTTEPYVEVPTAWTHYTFDLSSYDGEDIYIGIHCVSNDAFVLMIDDFQVTGTSGGPSEFIMNVVNSSANPGDIDHVVNVNGSWAEEIFAYFVQLKIGPTLSANEINVTDITLDGCAGEGAVYFGKTITNYGTHFLVDAIVVYYSPFEPGFGIPPGDGKLVNIFIDVDEIAEPQMVDITESPIGDCVYYIVTGITDTEFIGGHLEILSANQPPPTPDQPTGPTEGIVGVEYTYDTNPVIDPEGDDVEYLFDWGNGENSGWLADPSANYAWPSAGIYDVKVKARDVPHQAESDWSNPLEINISEAIPELEIESIAGGFGVSALIQNVGDANATDVNWSITLDGGLIILGKEKTGTVASIAEGEQAAIQSSLIFGIGKTTITVTAECAEGSSDEKTAEGFVLLFFVLGVQ